MPRKKKEEQVVEKIKSPKSKKVKKEEQKTEVWPKVIQGSHSTRTEYEDGRVDFVIDWDLLKRDVQNALTEYEKSAKVITTKPLKVKKTKNEA